MGGGSSKLNAGEGVVVPVKIRPLLLGRFEEFRKRRNGGTLKIEGTLSRKKLLKDGHEEDDGSNSQKYSENEKETQDRLKDKEQVNDEKMVVRVISIEKNSRVVPLPDSECESETKEEKKVEKDTNREQDNQEKVFHVDELVEELEEENTRENEQEVDAISDNDNDNESEKLGGFVYPRSPSFRIYCVETENKEEEEGSKNEVTASKNETFVVHKKSASADSIHTDASMNSRNSNEVTQIVEIETTQKRKGNKMKKFGAVRTLLKVKSCYHPLSSCTGNDRRHLVVEKMN